MLDKLSIAQNGFIVKGIPLPNVLEVIFRASGGEGVNTAIGKVNTGLGKLDSTMGKLGMGLGLAGLVATMGRFTVQAIQGAAEDEKLAIALNNVAGGAENAATYIEALTRATAGQVEDTDLAKMAMQLLSMETVKSADEAENFVEIARRLGDVFGQLSPEAAVTGFARMAESGQVSARFLIQYGMSATAVKQRVDELAESMPGLTDQQRTQQALLEVGAETMARLGPEQQDLITGQRQMAAASADFKDDFGAMLLEINNGVGATDLLTAAFRRASEGTRAWSFIITTAQGMVRNTIDSANAERTAIMASSDSWDDYQKRVQAAGGSVKGMRFSLQASISDYAKLRGSLAGASGDAGVFAAKMKQVTDAEKQAADGANRLAVAVSNAKASYAGMGATVMEDFEARAPLRQLSYDQDQAALDAQNEQRVRAQEEGTRAYESALADTASTLRSTIESVMQPTLSEVWQPPADAGGRIDEWARRLATMSGGNLSSEWRDQLTAQFGGQGFYQPVMDALSAGDSGALSAAVNNILLGPGVTQMWDKELIKARVLEQLQASNAREELINTVMAELSGQGVQVTAGEVGVAMGGAAPGGDIAGQLVGGMKAGLPAAIGESGAALTMIASFGTTLAGSKKEMEALAVTFMKSFNSYLPAAMGMAPGGFLEAMVTYVSARLGGGAGSARAAKAEARP